MNPHDYIISVDENGSPYLEHALFGKGSSRQNHKYYTRVEDKGRWRYFYSPEEFRVWSQGGKKVSNTDKMKSAFKTLKENGKKVADAAADKLGVDERAAAKDAWSKVPKQINSKDRKAMRALKKATEASREYEKTPLGKAENVKDRIEEGVRGAANDAADKAKSKFDRIKDELRKKKEAEESSKEEAKIERPTAHQKPEPSGSANPDSLKAHPQSGVKYGEYSEDDPDFDDANYKEENRVGDTDFFVHKRDDGTSVILEEDMKWELPKGFDGKSPEMKEALENWVTMRKAQNESGMKRTSSEITKELSDIIDSTAYVNKKTPGASEFKKYDKNDPDFSDENLEKADPIGDTEFYTFKRKDGTSVILEEDMKWVLPKGVDANDPEIKRAIENFASKDHNGWWDWQKDAKIAIDQAVSKASKSNNQPYLSKEYQERLEFNSRKNNYFGR